ncbi:MAG: glycerol kinase GlpK [Clostridiales Family XIII bacterium]|jgi:glycerol kinase|nr:glycerol kinase GlpK [Clostridiales Family XIII bacterium]
MKKYIMAFDQGTTSSRCIIFDKSGARVSGAQREYPQYYPHEGWVEQDPMDIWSTQINVAQEALLKSGLTYENIAAIGITNQRETTIVWDRETGEPVYNAIGWQCRRTSEFCDRLAAGGHAEKIREKTGLVVDAYFSATKIRWILDNVSGAEAKAEKGQLLFGTVETWLIWKLAHGQIHITDVSNASRTMLFNINTLKWDDELLNLFGIPAKMLPAVRPSSEIYGETDSDIFGGAIPISGAAGDQQSSLFGQACFGTGDAKNTYGTGCFLLMNTGTKPIASSSGLLTTIAWGLDGKVQYALEGSVFIAGAAIQWLRDEMGLMANAADSEKIAEDISDTGGVYLVPAFAGLGAPHWNPYARGTITGLTRGSTKHHIIRAALESIAYQSADLLNAMKSDAQTTITTLKVDGGASANNFLMQFQADILGAPVRRPTLIETTALGAAYLAGLAVGYWESTDEITSNWQLDRTFEPVMEEKVRDELLAGWNTAVAAACVGWIPARRPE